MSRREADLAPGREVRERVSRLVAALADSGGGGPAADDLAPLLYDELHRIACRLMSGESPGHTLQATAVAHEAYLRLVDQPRVEWRGRTHFLAVAAMAMRRVLVDHARGRRRLKRGGTWRRVTLHGALHRGGDTLDHASLLDLHDALDRLAAHDPRPARVVELRFFGGLKMDEVAQALGISKRTVEGDWTHARAWLRRELSR